MFPRHMPGNISFLTTATRSFMLDQTPTQILTAISEIAKNYVDTEKYGEGADVAPQRTRAQPPVPPPS